MWRTLPCPDSGHFVLARFDKRELKEIQTDFFKEGGYSYGALTIEATHWMPFSEFLSTLQAQPIEIPIFW